MRFRIGITKISISFWSVVFVALAFIRASADDVLIMLCLISAVLHELGHLVFITGFVGAPEKICINPFEVKIFSDSTGLSIWRDILISSAGVGVNFLLTFIAYVVYFFVSSEIALGLAIINLVMGIFNLLPVEDTDGAQILRLLVSLRFTSDTTDKLMTILSVIFIIPVVFISVSVLFLSKNNYSLLLVTIYFIISIINKEMR